MSKRELDRINAWAKKNTRIINVRCNLVNDKDIIDFLQDKRKGTYIKELIRADMKRYNRR